MEQERSAFILHAKKVGLFLASDAQPVNDFKSEADMITFVKKIKINK